MATVRDVFDLIEKHSSVLGEVRELPYAEKTPCVYLLCNGDDVVYVGMTMWIYQRVQAHRLLPKQRMKFDRVLYFELKDEKMMRQVEKLFISRLKPPFNRNILFKDEDKCEWLNQK